MSAQSETQQVPGVRQQQQQHDEVLGCSADSVGRVAATWQHLAELLDEVVTEYDEQLESGCSIEAGRASATALSELLDGFDVAAVVARRNGEVLDELATEITIAQARMRAIRNELETDRAGSGHGVVALERSYTARAVREVWSPLDGDIATARDELEIIRGEG